ncbi:MAG: SUMF1/EgtB/PvdO family nonheme iron enzyme [Verrucomicrobiota bacterium]
MKLPSALAALILLAAPASMAVTPDDGTPASLREAIADLTVTFGARYPGGAGFLKRLDALGPQPAPDALAALRREALLANPLLDIDRLLCVRRNAKEIIVKDPIVKDPKAKGRKAKGGNLGLPQNWQGNCSLPRTGYDDTISVLANPRAGGTPAVFYQPEKGRMVADIDLHFDAGRMLFSMIGTNNRWQIWEIKADGSGLRQVTPGTETDVDNYDPCYLPNGMVIFASTRVFQGVPCVAGSSNVANLFTMKPDGTGIRQLCFDQDHDWCPTVLNNGRVLYTRWEYSDLPHYFSRILMHMNPDGTGQTEFYGSNSYWPNSLFYARPIPGSSSKVAAIVSGHHGVPRMGELVILDSAAGRKETEGVVQRIPGHDKKTPSTIADQLVAKSWPRFLHPWPLGENYLLVSCQPTPDAPWGIHLVDTFDNRILIAEEAGQALFEPIPLQPRPVPPSIPDRVTPEQKNATVYLTDIYTGGNMAGVPRGTVKSLRVFEPHYAYPGMGGHKQIGVDGPWDVKRIHGTVPVAADGSASFTVPANTPLALQPLDADGRALQVMRSWFTTMPGESASCIGCHESPGTASPNRRPAFSEKPPDAIKPWQGPVRGFSFKREVQPVLDRNCVSCHNGSEVKPSLLSDEAIAARGGQGRNPGEGKFTSAYLGLHPFVRRPGPESDHHLPNPLEYHANTSELVQLLRKGHYGVNLERDAWDRLYTWIDLNVPDHGTWGEDKKIAANYHQRRLESRSLHANLTIDPETILPVTAAEALPKPSVPVRPPAPSLAGWPLDAASAARLQQETAAKLGVGTTAALDLGDGEKLDLMLIPPGSFVMGSATGPADESPAGVVKIDQPFLLGRREISNRQFSRFMPEHDSGFVSEFNKDHSTRGVPVNQPDQPVLRVSWDEAMAFCRWLSARTGKICTLPDEARWEYACRAGTSTPLSWGDTNADFSKLANLADLRVNNLTIRDSPDWIPSIPGVDDRSVATAKVGSYAPNAWGLHDMHGNAAEWTLSIYQPYPWRENDEHNRSAAVNSERVLRGGSYYDRPHRASSSFRLGYPSWQRVYNAGFRVLVELPAAPRKD